MPVSSASVVVDDAGDVAVADQPDRGARGPHGINQLGVARTVENAGRDVGHSNALRSREAGDVFGRRGVDIDDPFWITRTDRDLVHVDVGREQQAALLGDRDHGERVRQVLGADRRAFERIKRDIDRRPFAGPDLLADIEHRRLVPLALADHHRALDGEAVELLAHGIDGDLVGSLFVAAAAQPGGRDRGPFGDAHQFHGEYPVKAGDDVLGHIHSANPRLMPPPARGVLVLSNDHDNGKTCLGG
ncbi:hypothetical protein ACVWWD_004626 [Mesorhizobium sp. URHB0026]